MSHVIVVGGGAAGMFAAIAAAKNGHQVTLYENCLLYTSRCV